MASLKRTFAVLVYPMVRGIPHELCRQLLELSAPYSAHDEEDERLAKDYMPGDDPQNSWSDQEQGQRREGHRRTRMISAKIMTQRREKQRTATSHYSACSRISPATICKCGTSTEKEFTARHA